ncbi:cytochrome ubiquinol oxidase subunit I [Trebonia kvetii]|uniref:Cytochrome ubiquinol oxidase subunit I n=1 Tax=Trebonia kvetii TaxID=2480626 RepID=A0A6P2C173_9ACTN|nr:cytochrome ubiquinol oxidase subunit I [Trebonia kvetii]TVZ04900.1 cytochrome ubiquinol oxidase subunit I [Trebonia kvetii]
MSVLELSRWQFGITTVYHFLFVPITIGLGFLVAGFETAWISTKRERWLRLAKFYGKLFLINFALGVVTGIVQEFQFGMNWSAYSRQVGNIFGAPLAIEALLAFFLESTFLGLWIFGWDRLPPRLHAACMWIAATGTLLSAYFILAANAWMQHPVGSTYNPATRQDELTSFAAVLFNPAQLAGFPHVIAGCFLTAGALVAGVALWQILRPGIAEAHALAFRHALKTGAITAVIGAVAVIITGDTQGKLFTTQYQPMKMAAAEALYHTSTPAPFSLLTIGSLNGSNPVFEITLPRLLSFLATGNWSRTVPGIDNLQQQYQAQFGPGSYIPYVPVIYWSFRIMVGVGMLAALIAIVSLWATRRGRTPAQGNRGLWRKTLIASAIALPLLPLLGNSFGWIMTEMGRQPWLVYGQLKTADGVSANSAGEVLTSLIVFTVLYGGLAVLEVGLLLKYIKGGLTSEPLPSYGARAPGGEDSGGPGGADEPMQLVY